MNRTKEAVKNFVSRSGQHDTEVHESIQPAVTHENVKKTHHEDVNTAVDREIHHDHYHHTVQPVKDRQILPEEHHHQTVGVEHREFDERNHDRTKQAVAAEAAKFKDERHIEPTVHSRSAAPTVQGEHHHHHIHETVQPVIQRETVQPTVVHTTIPIHETHHKEAQHHGTTALPAISMDEFKSKGGTFGHDIKPHEHHYRYEGEPTEGGKIETGTRGGIIGGNHGHTGASSGTGKAMAGTAAAAGAAGTAGRRRRHHKRTDSNSSYSSSDFDDTDSKNYSTGGNKTGLGSGKTATGATSNVPGAGTSGVGAMSGSSAGMNAVPRSEQKAVHNASSTGGGAHHDAAGNPVNTGGHRKASLLDKLNPLKDSDGDGKAGFMK